LINSIYSSIADNNTTSFRSRKDTYGDRNYRCFDHI